MHVIVVLAGAFYMSIVVIQLMLQQMKNPLRYEEGRCVTRYVQVAFNSVINGCIYTILTADIGVAYFRCDKNYLNTHTLSKITKFCIC